MDNLGKKEAVGKLALARGGPVPYSAFLHADMAQLVEHNLAKVGVAGSSPVVRSMLNRRAGSFRPFCYGDVAKW